METSDGPCVKQNRDRTKLIPSKKNRLWKSKETQIYILCLEQFKELGMARMQ